MQSVQTQHVGSITSSKKGNWEIILADPSLNKFSLGQPLTDKYITTDIISPYGEKSILYNTVSQQEGSSVVSLNFEDIDQTKISSLSFKASLDFFKNWIVTIRDNRNNKSVEITEESVLPVNPIIELNKLANVGFVKGAKETGKSFFEIHLQSRTD